MQIQSDHTIDVTQNARSLGFETDLKVYVTHFVWERYIAWTVGDDHFFKVHQTQHERRDRILKDSLNLLSVCKKEVPEKELFFNRHIIVRKVHLAEPELALFKLTACNEHDEICLIIDAVNIT